MNFTPGRLRLLLVLLLAVVAAGLVVVMPEAKKPREAPRREPDIQGAVNRLFGQYHIDPKSVRTRTVKSGIFSRVEQRVPVPPEFNALNFNHDLALAMSAVEATVVATERSEDKSVTMHIKIHGVIVHSIMFVVKREGT